MTDDLRVAELILELFQLLGKALNTFFKHVNSVIRAEATN
jgi:hypothetical protein